MRCHIIGYIVAFIFFLPAAWAAEVSSAEVTYGGKHKGYLALPEGNAPVPGVVLIHEWWGLNDEIRAKAREYAEQGYVALAVDLYEGQATGDPKKARELATKVRNNQKAAFENLKASLDFLNGHKKVQKNRLASVGWCFGGGWSYQVARNNLGVKASVIYYGRFNPEDDLAQMRARILGHFAEKDRGILVDDVNAFQAKLKTLSGDHQVFIYPNTQHGFANPRNSIHNAAASDTAFQRTLTFLEEYL